MYVCARAVYMKNKGLHGKEFKKHVIEAYSKLSPWRFYYYYLLFFRRD